MAISSVCLSPAFYLVMFFATFLAEQGFFPPSSTSSSPSSTSSSMSEYSSFPGSMMIQKSVLKVLLKSSKCSKAPSSWKMPKTETRPTPKAKTAMRKEPMMDMMSHITERMQNRMGPKRWWISKKKIT